MNSLVIVGKCEEKNEANARQCVNQGCSHPDSLLPQLLLAPKSSNPANKFRLCPRVYWLFMLKFVQDFVGYAVPKPSFMDLVTVQVKKEFWIFRLW
jgi:hypothetical protein